MLDYIPVNWELLKSPPSWGVVLIIIMIGGLSLGLIFHPANAVNPE